MLLESTLDLPFAPNLIVSLPAEALDYLPHALSMLGLDGTIRAVNRAALRMLNYQSSEVIGRHFSHFLRSLDPPLLEGGFGGLLELGKATLDVVLRCGGDRFIQVEMQLSVFYDEEAHPSGVLVMSSEGGPENFLVRQALAKVADKTSRMIAYSGSGEALWSGLIAFCHELFETPGGWILLSSADGQQRIPFTAGSVHSPVDGGELAAALAGCSLSRSVAQNEELPAFNCMDCTRLASLFGETGRESAPRHHAVAPIFGLGGEKVGDLCLFTPPGRIFHHHELLLMDAITDQISQALEREELHLPSQASGVGSLSLAPINAGSAELSQLFEKILENLAVLVPFASAGVFLQEPDGLRLRGAVNHPQVQDLRGQFFPHADNLLNREIARTRKLIIVDDVRADARFQLWGGLDYIRSWMGLPLIVENKVIGVITLDREDVAGFSAQDGAMAQAFADQAAVALEKVRLAEDLRVDKGNLELLFQLTQTLVSTLEPEIVARQALELLSASFGDCFGEVYVDEGNEYLQLLATWRHPPEVVERLGNQPYLRLGVGIVGGALELRRPVLVPNVYEDPRWIWIPDLDLNVRSVAAIPLIARREVVGVLALSSPDLHVFTHHYLPLLQAVAAPVALALQNARLFVAERHRRQEAEMLRNATGALTLDLRLEQILQILLERLQQVVNFDSACVMLLEGNELRALAEIGLPNPGEVLGQTFPVNDSLFAHIQRERRAIFFNDAQLVPGFIGWGGTATTRGWLGVPLLHRGYVLGYITVDSLVEGAYGEREAGLAQAFANQMTITLVNAQLLRDSQQAAFEQQEVSGILRRLNGSASLTEIQAAAAAGIHRLIGSDAVEIALYVAEEGTVTARRSFWLADGVQEETVECVYSFAESAAVPSLRQGQSHISQDLLDQSQWPVEREWAEMGFRSHLALPLLGTDYILGHILLVWQGQMVPSQAIHFSLRQITDGVAMATEKLRLLEQATQRLHELQTLSALSAALRALDGREQITEALLAACLDVFSADRGYVLVPTADGEALEVLAHVGKGPIASHRRYGFQDSIAGRVFCSGVAHCSPNLFTDPQGHQPSLQLWAQAGLTFVSAIYAPLRSGEEIVGVLSLTNAETPRAFTPNDLPLLNAVSEIAGGALQRAMILEGLEQRVEERTAELARANVRLLELDQMKSDFVANVSHELRTPLTNIRLYLDLLSGGRPERREVYLQVLQRESEQLSRLIESILELSALGNNSSDIVPEFEIVAMNQLVESIYQRFHQQAHQASIEFHCTTGGEFLTVYGSRERLMQLGAHLVSNALNYTPAGGQVELFLATNDQDEVGLVVRDTGMGIPPDEIDTIFERFYRGATVRQSNLPGAGLGLSIAKEIAQAHGGRIAVQSSVEKGTTVTAWLPRSDFVSSGAATGI